MRFYWSPGGRLLAIFHLVSQATGIDHASFRVCVLWHCAVVNFLSFFSVCYTPFPVLLISFGNFCSINWPSAKVFLTT